MRIEERNNGWVRTWAFKITEQKAKHEGYESTKISSSMKTTPEYPGCPYCNSMTVAQCSCGKLFCWSGEWPSASNVASCPWCGHRDEYSPSEKLTLEGKGI
jgi:DNA-directed RNA polymerase subunit RPC12/RpoP